VTDFVLDNSVTMRWCFDSGNHAYADAVLQQLESASGAAFVPVLWSYEVSSVLARAEIRALLSAQKVGDFLKSLAALDIRTDDESARRVLPDVHRLAVQYRLTSYDAAYLELALRRGLPVATLDAELQEACKAAGVALR
jgi:predicted nucleic acid-binding protein